MIHFLLVAVLSAAFSIFPDYKGVTVPPNIAPLNFAMADSARYTLDIKGDAGILHVRSRKGSFRIPARRWKKLLAASAGGDLQFCISREGRELEPFEVHVAPEEADPFIVFRLVPPGYGMWRKMGIYQRDIRNFRMKAIYENDLTGDNCINCHSFPGRDPSHMLFHMRARNGGTVLMQGGDVQKLNTKTDSTISNLVYPYWHPSGRFIAFSVNKTFQAYHMAGPERIEVYDSASDVVVLDVEAGEIFSCPALKSASAFETFPSFSPDGRSLYFCTAPAVDGMPEAYREAHYSLCRIDFDPDTRSFGSKVDTLFRAGSDKSVSFPRVSPDGRFLVFTLHSFGNFSIWHRDADLWCIDLDSVILNGANGSSSASVDAFPLAVANSPESTDSYHSWSGNSRWLVFSSRRADGLYTRPFFTYIDAGGNASKAFMLPQKNPRKFYRDLMYSYNIPEFVSSKVRADKRKIAGTMRRSAGRNLEYIP